MKNDVPTLDPDLGVSPYRWWIFSGLWAGAVMEVLDTTIVNVAMPQKAVLMEEPDIEIMVMDSEEA